MDDAPGLEPGASSRSGAAVTGELASLEAIGWGDRWTALLAEHGPDPVPARVLRHDGVALQVRTEVGDRTVKLRRGVEPVTVGDWLVVDGEQVVALLDRASLGARRPITTGLVREVLLWLEQAAVESDDPH